MPLFPRDCWPTRGDLTPDTAPRTIAPTESLTTTKPTRLHTARAWLGARLTPAPYRAQPVEPVAARLISTVIVAFIAAVVIAVLAVVL